MTTEYKPGDFPHLNEDEWAALQRMVAAQGAEAVNEQFVPLDAEAQRQTLARFTRHEVVELQERLLKLELEKRVLENEKRTLEVERQQSALAASLHPAPQDRSRKPVPLKVDVARYKGTEHESLPRWFVELDAAILARCIETDINKVTFAMSNLSGRAKNWAYSRKLADDDCFLTYEQFKKELRDAFEPPKTEFRARTEFLQLRQGKRDVMTYAQHARYLVSCIVDEPIDDATQVSVFMMGMADGPAKTQLFREYPRTLEDAISRAMQEDFSRNQAYVHSAGYKPPRTQIPHEFDGTEPMDLSSAEAQAAAAQTWQSAQKKVTCSRCQKQGHWSYECLAPRPVPRKKNGKSQGKRGKKRDGQKDTSRKEAKNEKGQ